MTTSLEKIEKAYKILKGYDGENPYIIDLKNNIFVF